MKKRLFCLILLLFTSLTFSPSISFATKPLNIDRWVVDAHLLKNGDLRISEDISFNFETKSNSVYRNIVLKNIDAVEDLSIYEIISGKEVPYNKVASAKKGDRDKFTLKKDKKNLEIQIFTPFNEEKKSFRLKYLLKNIAIKHSDTAEIYYKFLTEKNKVDIDYFSINLYLPMFERDRISLFSHNDRQSKIYFSDQIIKSETHGLTSNDFIENRILFPNEYIPLSNNLGNKDLNSLLQEEMSFSQEMKVQIKKVREQKGLLLKIYFFILLFISIIISAVILKKKSKKIEANS